MGKGNAAMHVVEVIAIMDLLRFVMEDDEARKRVWPSVVTLLYMAGDKLDLACKALDQRDPV